MRLYVHMMMCGSICTLMYILFNGILSYELPLKWKRWLLRVNIIFYLLPVSWLVAELKGEIKYLLGIVAEVTFPETYDVNKINIYKGTDLWKNMLVFDAEGKLIYITGYEKFMPAIRAVLMLCVLALVIWIALYIKTSRQCKSKMVFLDSAHHYIEDQSTGKKVAVGISPCVASPVTVGLVKPVILLPVDYHEYQDALDEVLIHELNHVSCRDMIERFFCFAVIVIHVFNPLVHFLFREMVAVSEMISDDAALKGRTKKQKADYIRCIMTASQDVSRLGILAPSLRLSDSLLRKRMERIMGIGRKKVWKKGMAVILTGICVLGSSIPAMAYQKPQCCFCTDDVSGWNGTDVFWTAPKGIETPWDERTIDFSHGDEVCIDEDGRTYYYEQQSAQERSSCSHSYKSTIYSRHTKNSDGSCTVVKYDSKICTKCGDLIMGEKISTLTYKSCPH